MIGALLLLLQAAAPPTVGDTIWVSRAVRIPPGDSIRPGDWSLDGPVQLLGRARVTIQGDTAVIGYPLVAWVPGSHQLDVPGPILVSAAGIEDTLPAQSLTIGVASVLPVGVPDSALAPQPPATVVGHGMVTLLPSLILLVLLAILLLPVHLLWRRRGRALPPTRVVTEEPPTDEVVRRWSDAGEHRALAALLAGQLRAALARTVAPRGSLEDATRLLAALDSARFAPRPGEEAERTISEALRLQRSLGGRAR